MVSTLALAALVGCEDGNGAPDGAVLPSAPAGAEVVRSSRARITASAAPAEDLQALARGNAEFGLALYRAVGAEAGNVVMSPHSVSVALGMTWAGARTETETQMASALRFSMGQARTHAAFNALDLALAQRAMRPVDGGGQRFRLRVVNSLWGQRGYGFLTPFLDTLGEHYGAAMYLVDFVRDAEGARRVINTWVSTQTERRIPELLPMGVVRPSTVLVLTNAVYFSASWAQPFPAGDTRPADFHLLDGSTRSAPTMNRVAELRYAEGPTWQAVELPYVGEEVSMLVIVPAEGRFAEVERGLDGAALTAVVAGLHPRRVTLALPRFSFRKPAGLREPLMAMGMTDAFSSSADLSGMDGTRSLFIQDVLHEGYIAVDEAGTEAAAATAVIVGRVSAPEPATLRADRPFLFAIRDNPTGAVLFFGRVVEPSR